MSEEQLKIKRAQKGNFSIVPDDIFENKNLSLQARTVLGYMLGRPDNWIIYISHILKSLGVTESRWRSIRKELILEGYFHQRKTRVQGGKIKWTNEVTDIQIRPSSLRVIDGNSTDEKAMGGKTTDGQTKRGLTTNKTEYPNKSSEESTEQAEEAITPSSARVRKIHICDQMTNMGIERVNANNPLFLKLLNEISDECFIDTAQECNFNQKPRFDYILRVIDGRLKDAKAIRPL